MLKEPISLNDHMQGNLNAPYKLVEYGDYECPYCSIAHRTVEEVRDYFRDQLCYVFRNFPLKEIHPHAELAALSAEFAGTHGRFWEMHTLLFKHQEELNQGFIMQLMKSLDLPLDEFTLDLQRRILLPKIKSDFLSGVQSGVNGTPTFYINGFRYNGAAEFDNLVEAIKLQAAA